MDRIFRSLAPGHLASLGGKRMRKLFSLLVGGLWFVIGFSSAVAQEEAPAPPPPQAAPTPAAPEPPPYSLDLPELHPQGNGTGLFPNGSRQTPPTTTASHSGSKRRSSLATGNKQHGGRSLDRTLQKADADPLTVRVAYRRDKTLALARDPDLTVLLQRADAAGTDVQRRENLREYYTRLFASIRRLDSSPEMKEHLALLSQVAEQRYDPKRRVVAGEEDLLNTREGTGNVRLGR